MKKLNFIALAALYSVSAFALEPREEAWKLHNRLTGVPPRANVLTNMTNAINRGDREGAAMIAMQNPMFINVMLKNWVKPWSNRDQSSRVDLNDYVATILGVVRDDEPFDTVLYEDVLYTINGSPAAYSATDNNHYRQAEQNLMDLNANLRRDTQSNLLGTPANATAGVITSRAGGEAFFSAGTNRRVNRFTFMNYLCNDFEALHDTTVQDTWVRRDVERNPGGDSNTYRNKCKGCHAGQDALAGAWAYYDFTGNRLVYTDGVVVNKVGRPANNYSSAKPVTNDQWINLWASGQNAKLGWRGSVSGNGGKAVNEMFARSRAFAECMATKVYKLVCMKDPISSTDKATVQANATYFESGTNYSMKSLIARTSAGCMNE